MQNNVLYSCQNEYRIKTEYKQKKKGVKKRMTVNEFMQKSGIPLHLKGYENVKKSIEILIEHPEFNMKQVWSEASEALHCNYNNVERNIRFIINESYKNMDSNIKKTCFNGKKKTPTTAEYLKSVACAIRNNLI